MTGRVWALVPEVKDGAGFFTPETLTKANRQLASIEKKYHKDLVIETFPTPPSDKASAAEKMDAGARNRFFQEWARERAKSENV